MDINTKIKHISEIEKNLSKLQSKINDFNNKISILQGETNDKDIKELITLFNKLTSNINGVLTINCEKLNLVYNDLIATNHIFNNR